MKNFENIYSSLLELTQKVCGGAYAKIGGMYEKAINRMIERCSESDAAPERIVKILAPAAKKPEAVHEVKTAAPVKAAAPKTSAIKETASDIRAKAGAVCKKIDEAIFGTGENVSAKRRVVIAAAAVVLVATTAISGAVAFLSDTTSSVTNTFKPAEVETKTDEDWDGVTKANVKFENTGDMDVYIRANFIISIQDKDKNLYAKQPVAGTDYTITMGSSTNWKKGSDGFYYYTKAVKSGESTDVLIDEIKTLIPESDGLFLDVQVLSQAIQADPDDAVKEAWGMTASNGVLTVN